MLVSLQDTAFRLAVVSKIQHKMRCSQALEICRPILTCDLPFLAHLLVPKRESIFISASFHINWLVSKSALSASIHRWMTGTLNPLFSRTSHCRLLQHIGTCVYHLVTTRFSSSSHCWASRMYGSRSPVSERPPVNVPMVRSQDIETWSSFVFGSTIWRLEVFNIVFHLDNLPQ